MFSGNDKGPDIVFEEKTFDFGKVKENTVIEHTFRVLNRGGKTAEIKDIKTDCGCMTPAYDRKIPAAGQGNITLKLDTRGYEGKIKRTAVVFSNDPRNPRQSLTIQADVQVPIHLSKGHVIFKGVAGQEISKAIDIKAQLSKPLKLETSSFDLDRKVTYRIEEIDPGKSYRIHFSNIPGPAGPFHGSLKLKTNYPEKLEITIKIRARFKDKRAG